MEALRSGQNTDNDLLLWDRDGEKNDSKVLGLKIWVNRGTMY